jgi:hypothetical protein
MRVDGADYLIQASMEEGDVLYIPWLEHHAGRVQIGWTLRVRIAVDVAAQAQLMRAARTQRINDAQRLTG